MFKTLKSKMLVLFSIVVGISLLLINSIIISDYKGRKIEENRQKMFLNANIVSNIYKDNVQDILYVRNFTRSHSRSINARIIVVDASKKVIADSHNEFNDKNIDNYEIRNSLDNKSGYGTYYLNNEPVMQLGVPVTEATPSQNIVLGAVILSSDLRPISSDIQRLTRSTALISLFGLIMVIAAIYIISKRLTKPIDILTNAAHKISLGHFGERVNIDRKDEIGRLADTFNDMNERLKIVDTNRKKFIQDLSHELKTPLTSIKALIESMIISKDVKVEYLEDANSEIDRLSNMITTLLYSLRIGEEKLKINKYKLNDIVDEITKVMTPYADKNGVRIIVDMKHVIFIDCDKDRLKEILINLIDNSIKYQDESKESCVKVTGYWLEKTICLEIEDNGLGIEKQFLPYIFHEMFKLDANREAKKNSFGLGLSIVKKIVDLHGWSVSVESEMGKGTVFKIII